MYNTGCWSLAYWEIRFGGFESQCLSPRPKERRLSTAAQTAAMCVCVRARMPIPKCLTTGS